MSREGSLRTFLGTAPGVGKTYAMLAVLVGELVHRSVASRLRRLLPETAIEEVRRT